jgi:nucleoside-diphosphate-sugar epimerase
MMPISLSSSLLNLHRSTKRIIVILVDASLCVLALWLALYLRLGEFVYLDRQYIPALAASLILAIPIFIVSGLYRAIFRYSGWSALMNIAKGVLIYGVIYASVFTGVGIEGIPRTIGIIQPVLLLLLVGASRAVAYYWLGGAYKQRIASFARERVLIYGAGSAGRLLADALSGNAEIKILGFLDDDRRLIGRVLNGLTIYNPEKILEKATRLKVTHIYLALPSASRHRRQEIIEQMRRTQVAIRTLPSVSDIAQGKITINDLRELDIDDLLGREIVEPNYALLRENVHNKVVMVTGAGGSIGGELCRQIHQLKPQKLILFDHSEFALYQIYEEMAAMKERLMTSELEIYSILASVKDKAAVDNAIREHLPDTIYHAAAYKHVPLVEQNRREGLLNNTIGTKTVAESAIEFGVKNFVLVSTDKAVRPTNIMGASKRIAELIVQALADRQVGTRLSIVRFGNVLGSSGSVVPKFREQIAKGGPVTVTHPDVTRFFMTIPEAAQLVIQAGTLAEGGDVFILHMGEPVKIIDLARTMIELSGRTVFDENENTGDIEISITGLREGEKLYEELLIGDDPQPTDHPKIMKAKERKVAWETITEMLDLVQQSAIGQYDRDVMHVINTLVPEYVPDSGQRA